MLKLFQVLEWDSPLPNKPVMGQVVIKCHEEIKRRVGGEKKLGRWETSKAGAILLGMTMEGIFDKVMGEKTWRKWEVMQILVKGFSRQWDEQCKGVEVYVVCVSLDQGPRPV